jgi:hypothetical protein
MQTDRPSIVDSYDDSNSGSNDLLLKQSDVRKKKFMSLFPGTQNVSIVLANTSAAYCLKV